jgi:PTH1 family peptidyl-tRNA hydrolase
MVSPTCRYVVGLGNPGERYRAHRHNVGYMVADALAREASGGPWSSECLALTSRMSVDEIPLMLVKPLAFMNRSGESLRLLRSKYGFEAEDLIVVLDDLNLPFGRLRIRERGSAGGHRGLESVLEVMGTDEIFRLRLGIGEERMPEDKAPFVLSDFSRERLPELEEMIGKACGAVRSIVRDGVTKAMMVYNA